MDEHDARILRGAVAATVLVALPAVALGWLAAGGRGALGGVLGVLLAAVFFSITVVVVAAAARVATELILPAALATYALKLVALGIGLYLLDDTTAFDKRVFALSVVAATMVYLIAEVRLAVRARIPYVVGSREGR
jgi:ATP synthase protein I